MEVIIFNHISAYDMIIPAESTVELCEKPKYLASGYKLTRICQPSR